MSSPRTMPGTGSTPLRESGGCICLHTEACPTSCTLSRPPQLAVVDSPTAAQRGVGADPTSLSSYALSSVSILFLHPAMMGSLTHDRVTQWGAGVCGLVLPPASMLSCCDSRTYDGYASKESVHADTLRYRSQSYLCIYVAASEIPSIASSRASGRTRLSSAPALRPERAGD